MKALRISENVYWVGAIDWNVRNFHGYETEKGTTYNAYLILDEKITLVDTVKDCLQEEMLERIRSVIEPDKIDVIISNHAEPDHSGALPFILRHAPRAKVYAVSPAGEKDLGGYYGDLPVVGVKTGDKLSVGKHEFAFVSTPMVHWPDNMVCHMTPENILFSNDAFGQHYASSTRFDTDSDLPEVLKQAKKYYANIVQPYGLQTKKALEAVSSLQISMICPATASAGQSISPRSSPAISAGRRRTGRTRRHRLRYHVALHRTDGARAGNGVRRLRDPSQTVRLEMRKQFRRHNGGDAGEIHCGRLAHTQQQHDAQRREFSHLFQRSDGQREEVYRFRFLRLGRTIDPAGVRRFDAVQGAAVAAAVRRRTRPTEKIWKRSQAT